MSMGLFLGAGASYEVGMPLVWEFSNTLRINLLKRIDSKLFNIDENQELRNVLTNLLSNQDIHYEEVVGELEKLYLKSHKERKAINGVLAQLIECIQLLLLEDQMNTLKLLSEKIKDYYGIIDLVNRQGVLNVFSLNHDIVFEEICDHYEIAYRDGFFPLANNYNNVANFKIVTREKLESGEINLFKANEKGVNLIKLHGSLDIFAAEDKNLFLKTSGSGESIGSHLQEIIKVENTNLDICTRDKLRTTNELCVYDKNNELQFLRRSLLSGAHKFQDRFEQIAPIAFFDAFKKQLKNINELIVIGYGFGDPHVNDVLHSWILDESRKITIYDPHRKDLPSFLSEYASRTSIVHGGLSDFFLSFNSSRENLVTKSKRKILNDIRVRLKEKRES